MESVEQRVIKIVAEQLGVNEADIKNESTFVDDLGADSLDTVELVMAPRRNLSVKYLMKKQRKYPQFNKRLTMSMLISIRN